MLEAKTFCKFLKKSRKRIETLFSQLCDQFMIRRNYAKSFQGFKTRILAKITALTLVQYINKFLDINFFGSKDETEYSCCWLWTLG